MNRLNSKTAKMRIQAHTLEALRYPEMKSNGVSWEELPERELLQAFWGDYKRIANQPYLSDPDRWRRVEVWESVLRGVLYYFEWEDFRMTEVLAGFFCNTEEEQEDYMRHWWDENDDIDPWPLYAKVTWGALWGLSRKNHINPARL